MELRHLRYFVAVAESLNFTRAARTLGTAQPPLSVQIRNLEAELGTPLFTRANRKVALTPAGCAFLPEARSLLAAADRAVRDLQDEATGRAGSLRIVADPGALSERVTRRLRKFIRKHRGLRIELEVIDYQYDSLEEPFDVRIVHTLSPPDAAIPLETSSVCFALPPKHRLQTRPSIEPADLAGEVLLLGANRSPADRFVVDHADLALTTVAEGGHSPFDRFSRVSLGLGIAPCSSSDRFLGDSVAVPFLAGTNALHTVLEVHPRSKAPAVAALVEFIRA